MFIESNYKEDKQLILFPKTVEKHKLICERLKIFGEYTFALNDKKNIGGISSHESRRHFLARYLNSAARTQLLVDCIDEELKDLSEDIISYFLDGAFYIVDIAAGHGAGVISIINHICKLRKEGGFPTEKLNIVIYAIDYSEQSLGIYKKVIDSMKGEYFSLGINVKLNKLLVDISSDENLYSVVNKIKTSVGGDPRYLLICSAISGVGRISFEEKFVKSYLTLTSSFSSKNSDFFWIEPAVKKNWVNSVVDDIHAQLSNEELLPEVDKIKMEFIWKDPYTESSLKSQSEIYRIKLSHE